MARLSESFFACVLTSIFVFLLPVLAIAQTSLGTGRLDGTPRTQMTKDSRPRPCKGEKDLVV